MRALKILSFILLATLATVVAAPKAEAGKTAYRYSVVTLVNKTKYRIYYDYVWGEDADKSSSRSLGPGETYIHWWKFSRVNQNWAPYFHVRVHGHSGWYKLNSFYSADTKASSGREYAFKASKGSDGVDISLHARLYTK